MNQKQFGIHENAIRKAKNCKRAEGELICALEEVEKEKLYYLLQCKSLLDYCKRYMELSEDVAMNFIGVMRKSIELPALKDAVVKSGLSVSQARKIAPILTPSNQGFWIHEAKTSSAWDLREKLASHFPERLKKETIRAVNDEYVSITIRVKKIDFEVMKKAKDLKSKKIKKTASMEETCHPVPIQVVTKKTPQASLHQVNLRDQGKCQFRGEDGTLCLSSQFTEIHHIRPKANGGTHEISNLITLCSGHHRALHFGVLCLKKSEAFVRGE